MSLQTYHSRFGFKQALHFEKWEHRRLFYVRWEYKVLVFIQNGLKQRAFAQVKG